jgi:hypothetical protein
MKDKILQILAFIWTTILPLLLVITFNIGILFNLWKVQNLSLTLSIIITLITTGLLTWGFGKLLKKW